MLFLPAGAPPHKLDRPLTPGRTRADLVELAIAGHPAFSLDRRELQRTGPSYTVLTLSELTREQPGTDLFFLAGADSLSEFLTWKDPAQILSLATLVVVNRGSVAPPSLDPLRTALGPQVDQRVQFVQMPGIEISSRDLRYRVSLGESIRYLTPRSVEMVIAQKELYRGNPSAGQ